MTSRLDRLRASTRPARRWLASWLLAPMTVRRWLLLVLVAVGWLLSALVGCSTPPPVDPVRAEAQRLRALYGDPRNWPAEEWARWEEAARGSR